MSTTQEQTTAGNNNRLTQIAADMLMQVDLPDTTPVLCLLYNVAARPPGPPSYAIAPTDREMWDCMPAPRVALDLLTKFTALAPVVRPPGSLPAPLSHLRVDRRAGRLDGTALLLRAWMIDSLTAAGRAMTANLAEGFYRRGDIAASPQRRDIRSVAAVTRDGTRIGRLRTPDGPVQGPAATVGLPASEDAVQLAGAIPDGLEQLLTALRTRFARR